MIQFQQKNSFFILNLDQPHPQQHQFFDPIYWQQQNRILGSAKGRGTTWFLHTQDLFGCNTALRHYYRGGLLGKINRDFYCFTDLQATRSFAEFALLNQLHQLGLPVPRAFGAKIEKSPLGYYRADILTEKIENAQDLTALLQKQTLNEQQWFEIGSLIRKLHDQQVCHTDLNAHNILIQQVENKLYLLDFDKCGFKTGNDWKQENLVRLHRSFLKEVNRMKIQFNQENWQQLLQGYQISM